MSNIGVYTKDLVDIGLIFKQYTSGTKVLNQFFTKDLLDIGNLLQTKHIIYLVLLEHIRLQHLVLIQYLHLQGMEVS